MKVVVRCMHIEDAIGMAAVAQWCTDSSVGMASSGLSCSHGSHFFKLLCLFLLCMSDICDMLLIQIKKIELDVILTVSC